MTESEWLASTDPKEMLSWMQRPRGPFLGISTGDPRRPNVEVSDRKLRLFACACWRCFPSWRCFPPDESSLNWLEALAQLEEVADGTRTEFGRSVEGYICCVTDVPALLRYLSGLWAGRKGLPTMQRIRDERAVGAAYLLRCIVGNPFRPASRLWQQNPEWDLWQQSGCSGRVDMEEPPKLLPVSAWLTPAVLAVAQAIYEERRFDEVGVLADALEESGLVAEEPCKTCEGKKIIQYDDGWGAKDLCPTCHGTGRIINRDAEAILSHLRGPGPHVRGCWVLDLLLGKENS